MEGSKLMGILDDVTHSGDQPEIVLPTSDKEIVYFSLADEDIVALKDWLNLATDAEKEIVVDGEITKVNYLHPKVPARPTLVKIREKVTELFKTDPAFMARISKYHTIAYSNTNPFVYVNTVFADSEMIDENQKQYKLYIVLDGHLQTSLVQLKSFAKNEAYCVLTDPCTEELSSVGTEDSLVLCLTLS
jgi:hypothetical protein